MVEVQVRRRDRDDAVGLDRPFPEPRDNGAHGRAVGGLDVGIAEPDPGVEEHDTIGMDDRVAHHDTRPACDRAT
jgi:hypothetical protein